MSLDPGAAGLIADLQGRLDAVADPGTKTWFESYLKHVIGYRGVKTPVVTRIVAEWRSEHGLERLPDDDQLALARSLIEESLAEDKFAGILYMQKYLVRRLEPHRLLEVAEGLFAEGAFFDWSTSFTARPRAIRRPRNPGLRRGGASRRRRPRRGAPSSARTAAPPAPRSVPGPWRGPRRRGSRTT